MVYFLFLIFFNVVDMAWHWPRFMIPVMPVLLFCVRDWLPTDRRIVSPLAVGSALLASAEVIGFKSVFGFPLHR